MKRREFIFDVGLLSLPLVSDNGLFPLINHQSLSSLLDASNKNRKLVLIFLSGGNDGLNMVFPIDQYLNLANARPNMIVEKEKLLSLTDMIGLHPSMTEMKGMYDEEKVLILQNVGYPQPNFSHFRSKEIIMSGSGSDENIYSGWMGRFLQKDHPNFPVNYPNDLNPHPLALTIASTGSPTCQANGINMGVTIQNLSLNYQSGTGSSNVYDDTPYGHELKFVEQAMDAAEVYLTTIREAADKAKLKSTRFPAKGTNSLADQLGIVSQLIAGGLQTQIYALEFGGFDLHANAVKSTTETDLGKHADLLSRVSVALDAFQDDLELQGADNDVIGLVYTEFGRRIKSNSSNGTDHGTAFPVILFGKQINPTVLGSNPQIPETIKASDNLVWKIDFRSIYSAIFREWFEVDESIIEEILYKGFEEIPILKSSNNIVTEFSESDWVKCYPNPVSDILTIDLIPTKGKLQITLYSSDGKMLQKVVENNLQNTGLYNLKISMSAYTKGSYLLHVCLGKKSVTKTIVKN